MIMPLVIRIGADTLHVAPLEAFEVPDGLSYGNDPVPFIVVPGGDVLIRGSPDSIQAFLARYTSPATIDDPMTYVRVRVGEGPSFRPRHVFASVAGVVGDVTLNSITVLDVGRSDSSFAAGHIPGAQRLSLKSLVTSRDGRTNELPATDSLVRLFQSLGVSNDRPVLLYGDTLAAARAFVVLDVLGHPDVRILESGLEDWPKTSVDTGPGRTAERGTFTAVPDERRLIDAAELRTLLGRDDVPILDARPAEEFTGRVRSAGAARSGRIPGARSVPWRQVAAARWDSVSLLMAVPEYAPEVIVYCNSGLQASYLYAVARHQGYPVRLYDGSFQDWSRRKGFPVEVDGRKAGSPR